MAPERRSWTTSQRLYSERFFNTRYTRSEGHDTQDKTLNDARSVSSRATPRKERRDGSCRRALFGRGAKKFEFCRSVT